MTKSGQNSDVSDDLHSSSESAPWPNWKIFLSLAFGFSATTAVSLIVWYALRKDAKPSELGLGSVLVFCLAGLALLLIPWEDLGLRLKKVGPVEFEEVIKSQKKEQSESIAYLQNQVDEIKQEVNRSAGGKVSEIISPPPPVVLATILERFLRQYRGTFFSPLRINKWGSRQPGFEELKRFSYQEVSQSLLSMLAANRAQTKISRRGNTLFGLSSR